MASRMGALAWALILTLACIAQAVHFDLGTIYRYHVTTIANSNSDVTRTVVTAGGVVSGSSKAVARYFLDAEFDVIPYTVEDDQTFCRLTFVGKPKLYMETSQPDGTIQQAVTAQSVDLESHWFSFVLNSQGIVQTVLYEAGESDQVLSIKRGIINAFSANTHEAGRGTMRKRSFETEEVDYSGPHTAAYHVQHDDQKNHVVFFKRHIIPRTTGSGDDDHPDAGGQLDRSHEKRLVKNIHDGHILSIAVNDRVYASVSAEVKSDGIERRDVEESDGHEQKRNLLLHAAGSTDIKAVSKRSSDHIVAVPLNLVSAPLYVSPPQSTISLKEAMLEVDKVFDCFDGSVIYSRHHMSNGQKLRCYGNTQRALQQIRKEDARKAARYLLQKSRTLASFWVGWDLVSDICRVHDNVLDIVVKEAAFADAREVAVSALRAGLACRNSTSETIDLLEAVVQDRSDPEIEAPAIILTGRLARHSSDHGTRLRLFTILKDKATTVNITEYVEIDPKKPDEASGRPLDTKAFIAHRMAARHATILEALGEATDILEDIPELIEALGLNPKTGKRFPSVVQTAALRSLGKFRGQKAERKLIEAMVEARDPMVREQAKVAYGMRRRSLELEDLLAGAEELRAFAEDELVGPLSRRALETRDLVNAVMNSTSINVILQTPRLMLDKKLGADIVGVRPFFSSSNKVELFASLIKTTLSVDVANIASASLYIDIGGPKELEIFKAQMLFQAEVGYDLDMLKDFKLEYITDISASFDKVKTEIKETFDGARKEAEELWGNFTMAIDKLKQVAENLMSFDFASLSNLDDLLDEEGEALMDLFLAIKDQFVNFGLTIKDIISGTIDTVLTEIGEAFSKVRSAVPVLLDCPQQAVAALISGVEDVKDGIEAIQTGVATIKSMLSPDSLLALLPDIEEDFLDEVKEAVAGSPLAPLVNATDTFFDTKELIENLQANMLNTYVEFRINFEKMKKAYNVVKTFIDSMFGAKMHKNFPNVPAADANGQPQVFPTSNYTTISGKRYSGMRLSRLGTKVVAPMAGIAKWIDSRTVAVEVTENSLKKSVITLGDVRANNTITEPGIRVKKGDIIGDYAAASIHISIQKPLRNGTLQFIDPVKYLRRRLPTFVKPFQPTANSYDMTVVGQAIVGPATILDLNSFRKPSGAPVTGQEVGVARQDLVARGLGDKDIDVCNEFANNETICATGTLPEFRKNMVLFETKQYFMVGGIPLTFELQFTGLLGVGVSLKACIVDLSFDPTITPHFAVQMIGQLSLGVGISVDLRATGTVADTRVPIAIHFPLAKIPTGACMDINIDIVPLSLEISVGVTIIAISFHVVIVRFAMDAIRIPIMNSCPIPGVRPTDAKAFLLDATPPVFADLSAIQVAGETPASPLIFARFSAKDPESGIKRMSVGWGWSPGDTSIVQPYTVPLDQGDSLTFHVPADRIYDEKVLFVSVMAENQQNISTTQSVPVLFDLSPPVVVIGETYTPIENYTFGTGKNETRSALRKLMQSFTVDLNMQLDGSPLTGHSDILNFTIDIRDATPLKKVVYALGTALLPGRYDDAISWTAMDFGHASSAVLTLRNLTLVHGLRYFLTIRATNLLGYETEISSRGTLVDLSPPLIGYIYQGPQLREDSGGTRFDTVALFNFNGFTDLESDIAYWHFAVGPSNMSPEDISWVPFGNWSSRLENQALPEDIVHSFSVRVPEGNHTLCVQSTNFVGLKSVGCKAGYIVDLTAPYGSIHITHGNNSAVIGDLNLTFNYTDNLSGVRFVWLGLGNGADAIYADYIVLDLDETPDAHEWKFVLDPQFAGEFIFAQMILWDRAGNSFAASSDEPVVVDFTPPDPGVAFVGPREKPFRHSTYVGNVSELCVSWRPCMDDLSGVAGYNISAGTFPGSQDIYDWTTPPKGDFQACMTPRNVSSIEHDTSIYVAVSCWNGNGDDSLSTTFYAPLVRTDFTPPLQFDATIIVKSNQLVDEKVQYTADATTIKSTWAASSDPESGVLRYELAVGSKGNDTALRSFQPMNPATPRLTSATLIDVPLTDGTRFYVVVKAINGAGLTKLAYSQAVTIDQSPPLLKTLQVSGKAAAGKAVTYVTNARNISVLWAWQDLESGIVSSFCQILDQEDLKAVNATTVISDSGCTLRTSVDLSDGKKYIIRAWATNGAGLSTTSQSVVLVSYAPPELLAFGIGAPSLNAPNITNSTYARGAQAWWKFRSSVVPIVGYSYAFGSEAGAQDITGGWIETSNQFTIFPHEFNASNLHRYFLSVKAILESGIESNEYTPDFGTRVVPGAEPGRVIDGPFSLQTAVQVESDVIMATFDYFKRALGYPGASYKWGLGTAPDVTDVLDLTTVDLFNPSVDGPGVIYHTGTKLRTNITYYVTVEGTFGDFTKAKKVTATSSGFMVKNKPPASPKVLDGLREAEYHVPDANGLSISCNANDALAGLNGMQLSSKNVLSQISDTFQTVMIRFNSSTESIISRQFNTTDVVPGTATFFVCEAFDLDLGLRSSSLSRPIILDNTPPLPSDFSCGPLVASSTSTITCHWQPMKDAESGNVEYVIWIGSSKGGNDISRAISTVGNEFVFENHLWRSLSPPSLHVTLSGTNNVGLSSFISWEIPVDYTPPIAVNISNLQISGPYRKIGRRAAVTDCLIKSTPQLTVAWDGVFTDNESQSLSYRLAIASQRMVAEAPRRMWLDWQDIGTVTRETIVLKSSLPVDSKLYVLVEARNDAGLTSLAVSEAIGVVDDGPRNLYVVDTLITGNDPSEVSLNANQISARWAFSHACPIRSYYWVVRDNLTDQNVTAWTETSRTAATAFNLQLTPNRTYIVEVQAWNNLGMKNSMPAISAGSTIIFAPARPGNVFDGPAPLVDIDEFPQNSTEVYASWTDFSSTTCRVRGYEWAIGSNYLSPQGKSDVMDFIHAGLNRTVSTVLASALPTFQTFYITVRATSCTGELLYAFSNGFHFGQREPPSAGIVRVSHGFPAQPYEDRLSIHWTGYVSIWSPLRTDAAVEKLIRGTNVSITSPYVPIAPGQTSIKFDVLDLLPTGLARRAVTGGQIGLRGMVRATDLNQQTSMSQTEIIWIDNTPPVALPVRWAAQRSNDSILWQSSDHNVSFTIAGYDEESGVYDIQYSLVESAKAVTEPSGLINSPANIVVPWTSIGGADSTDMINLNAPLKMGRNYYIVAKIINGANLSTLANSIPLAVDLTGPVSGAFNIGPDLTIGVRYSSSNRSVQLSLWESTTSIESQCKLITDSFETLDETRWKQGVIDDISSSSADSESLNDSCASVAYEVQLKPGRGLNGTVMACELMTRSSSQGSVYEFRLKAATGDGIVSSLVVSEGDGFVMERSYIINQTYLVNGTFPHSSVGVQLYATSPPVASIWTSLRGESAWRARTFRLDANATEEFLTYRITIKRDNIIVNVFDDDSYEVGSASLPPFPSTPGNMVSFSSLKSRIRVWGTTGTLPPTPLLISEATYPTDETTPCAFLDPFLDLESGIERYEVSIGTGFGTSDIQVFTPVNPSVLTDNGCLDEGCFLSRSFSKQNAVLMTATLSGLDLVSETLHYEWCDLSPVQGGCSPLARCIDQSNAAAQKNFTCECVSGYKGYGYGLDGCVDVDECNVSNITSACGPNTRCRNTPGSFVCECLPGFVGNPYNSANGCMDFDECADAQMKDLEKCQVGSVCRNLPGDFACDCLAGYTQKSSKECADIDECEGVNSCAPRATCVNTQGGYTCKCPYGTFGDGVGPLGCLAPGDTCTTAAMLPPTGSLNATLLATDVNSDPRPVSYKRGELGHWYRLGRTGPGVTVSVRRTSGGLIDGYIRLSIYASCWEENPVNACTHGSQCTLSLVPSISANEINYVYVASAQPVEYLIGVNRLTSLSSCSPPCQNGGTCVAPNNCECLAGWTGTACDKPAYDMLPRKSIGHLSCLPFTHDNTAYAKGECAIGYPPNTMRPALAQYTFEGCYQFPNLDKTIDAPYPQRLSLAIPNSRLYANVSVQECANHCVDENLPIFTYASISPWMWPKWYSNDRPSCLCMPRLPEGTRPSTDGACALSTKYHARLAGSALFTVRLPAPWCPVIETLSASTDFDLSFNKPALCAPRTTRNQENCIFPFFFKGKRYTDCTSVDDSAPWCFIDRLFTTRQYCTQADYCSGPERPCGGNSTCVSGTNTYECVCNEGFERGPNGNCVDIDECEQGIDDCDPRAECINTVGSYACSCDEREGLFLETDGKTCLHEPDKALKWADAVESPAKPNVTAKPNTYFLNLRAINRAGLASAIVSQPFTIDQSPPTLQSLMFMRGDLETTVYADGNFNVSWDFADSVSGIAYYRYAVGLSELTDDVLAWNDTLSKSVPITVQPPGNGGRLWVSVIAFNGALLSANASTSILIDSTPPVSKNASCSVTSFGQGIKWKGFTEDFSQITGYEAAIGGRPLSLDNIFPWTLAAKGDLSAVPIVRNPGRQNETSVYIPDLLSLPVQVHWSLRAVNEAGLVSDPITASNPAVVLGVDAGILDANSANATLRRVEDNSTVAVFLGSVPTGFENIIAAIPMSQYHYDVSKLTNYSMSAPAVQKVLRVGMTYALYLGVDISVLHVSKNGTLSLSALPTSIKGQIPGVKNAPASHYLATIYRSGKGSRTDDTRLPVAQDPRTGVLTFNISLPGLYSLYAYINTPTFLDLDADRQPDLLFLEIPNWTLALGNKGEISPPLGAKNYSIALSSKNLTVLEKYVTVANDIIVNIADWNQDGIMDLVLLNPTTNQYSVSIMGAARYVANKTTLQPPSISGKQGPLLLVGLADLDDNGSTDSFWANMVPNAPQLILCAMRSATTPCQPTSVSLQGGTPIGMGTWGTEIGVLTYQIQRATITFYVQDLAVTNSGNNPTLNTVQTAAVSRLLVTTTFATWIAQLVGDLNGDGTSDLILQCTSQRKECGPSGGFDLYTMVWYLGAAGKVIEEDILKQPVVNGKRVLGMGVALV